MFSVDLRTTAFTLFLLQCLRSTFVFLENLGSLRDWWGLEGIREHSSLPSGYPFLPQKEQASSDEVTVVAGGGWWRDDGCPLLER